MASGRWLPQKPSDKHISILSPMNARQISSLPKAGTCSSDWSRWNIKHSKILPFFLTGLSFVHINTSEHNLGSGQSLDIINRGHDEQLILHSLRCHNYLAINRHQSVYPHPLQETDNPLLTRSGCLVSYFQHTSPFWLVEHTPSYAPGPGMERPREAQEQTRTDPKGSARQEPSPGTPGVSAWRPPGETWAAGCGILHWKLSQQPAAGEETKIRPVPHEILSLSVGENTASEVSSRLSQPQQQHKSLVGINSLLQIK